MCVYDLVHTVHQPNRYRVRGPYRPSRDCVCDQHADDRIGGGAHRAALRPANDRAGAVQSACGSRRACQAQRSAGLGRGALALDRAYDGAPGGGELDKGGAPAIGEGALVLGEHAHAGQRQDGSAWFGRSAESRLVTVSMRDCKTVTIVDVGLVLYDTWVRGRGHTRATSL